MVYPRACSCIRSRGLACGGRDVRIPSKFRPSNLDCTLIRILIFILIIFLFLTFSVILLFHRRTTIALPGLPDFGELSRVATSIKTELLK